MDKETANPLASHLGDMPADFFVGDPIIPKPEGEETSGQRCHTIIVTSINWSRDGSLPVFLVF
jgi:hypothetical protein